MAIILAEKNLEALFAKPASMDSLLEATEEALRAHQRGEVPDQASFQLPLPNGRRLRVLTAAVHGAGKGLRIFPLFRGAKDAHFNLLFDLERGDLLALVAGGELNVWRTGAPAGVACRYLKQPEARHLAMIGSGRQAKGQLLAIQRSVPSLEKVRVFSPNEEHRAQFAKQMRSWLEIDIEAVGSAQEAVEGAHIVDLATSSRAPVIDAHWIAPGTTVISIAGGQVPDALVSRSRVIVTWKEELLKAEPPREPYAAMTASGSWSSDEIAGELGAVILGVIPARQEAKEIVLLELLAMPMWDATAAAWAYRWARENRIGASFSLA